MQIAENAPEAVGIAITTTPAVIFIDEALPDGEMFSLLQALKAEDEAARIPIVLLTDDLSQEGLYFHAEMEAVDNAALLDSLCEQLARVISAPELIMPTP